MHSIIPLLALLPSALAHFTLNYPYPLGYPIFNDETEGDSPCGGQPIAFASNDSSVTVGGFQLAARTTHPEAEWLFRATLSTAEPYNWTNILPVVRQTGLGVFCATNLSLPAEFAGQRGLIQVTQGATDGSLYQCAPVTFVTGSTTSWPAECINASGVTATVTTQDALDNTTTASGSSTASTASATASGSAIREVAGGLLALLPVGMLLL